MHWNNDWHMGEMSFWWLPIIAVLALVVWFAFSAASAARRRGAGAQASPPKPTADDEG
jgi:hypothetical protein